MTTYKFARALSDARFNIDKLLNEFKVATGEIPLWSWTNPEKTILCLDFPPNIDAQLIADIVRRNSADEMYTTGALLFGAANGMLNSAGIQTNQPAAPQPNLATVGAALIDQRLGDGDPYDDGNPFTGHWLVYPAREYPVGSGSFYNDMWIYQNTLMVGASSTDGKFYSGAGAVKLDSNGITLDAGSGDPNIIKWREPDSSVNFAKLYGDSQGSAPNRGGYMSVSTRGESSSAESRLDLAAQRVFAGDIITLSPRWDGSESYVLLTGTSPYYRDQEVATPATPPSGYVSRYVDTSHNLRIISSLGMDDILHHGDEAGFSTYTNDAAQTTFYTRTIKGGSLGAYGVIRFTAIIQIDNGTAGGRTSDIKIKLGATTFVTLTTASIGAGNSRRVTIIGAITNQADAAVQELSGTWFDGATAGQLSGTAAINTANDTTLTLTNTLSSAGALTFKRQSVIVHGPYLHAS